MSRQFGNRTSVRNYQNLHNRSVLLGDARPDDDRTSSPSFLGDQQQQSVKVNMNDRDLDYLESQNDDEITGLSAKVKILKNITGKIGEEIRHGNSFIDTMNDQFSNTGSVLGKTMNNFKLMAEKESGTMWCCETSKTPYKIVEYNNTLYQIPVRNIEQDQVLLLSDVQSLIPKASAFLSDTKLVPFLLHPITYAELAPKRVSVSTDNTIWQVQVPQDDSTDSLVQYNIQMQIKLDQLSEKLERFFSLQQQESEETNSSVVSNQSNNTEQDISLNESQTRTEHQQEGSEEHEQQQKQQDPPPAFNSPSHEPSSSGGRNEAPPSYETSVLSTITTINAKLRLYESHIANRHKSPRWLSKRQEWLARVPNSIEEVAYQLVQLEMALLWTAVTESWIEERETWLTLVANARSEKHLAGAMINLERHTLVMDDGWAQNRERWINELLEMLVLPISHV
ncbi:hypothetical protein BDF21DRAFT_452805 [Thamnidium elegans]|nr:hypothetical protein BDF21DRAFT_452805 [Thamnidium elegans]